MTLHLIQVITQFEMFFLRNSCQTYTVCRHRSLKYCNSNIHFLYQKVIKVQSLVLYLSHQNHYSSHNSGTIFFSRATLERVYFLRKINLKVASGKALVQGCCSMKYGTSIRSFSFEIVFLNSFRKFLENYQ